MKKWLFAILTIVCWNEITWSQTNYCTDTVRYTRRHAPHPNFVAFKKPGYTGYGQYFPLEDTAIIYGVKLYCFNEYNADQGDINIYHTDTSKLPTAFIHSQPFTIPHFTARWVSISYYNTGHYIAFSPPLVLTEDFVITVEAKNGSEMKVGSNHWHLHHGQGKGYSSIRINGIWRKGKDVMFETPYKYDAEITVEPLMSYRLRAKFDLSPESCPGNGDTVEFINSTFPMFNEVYSPSYNPITGSYNNFNSFEWDYGDNSSHEFRTHGKHQYNEPFEDYTVSLRAVMHGWSAANTCIDYAHLLVQSEQVKRDFKVNLDGNKAYFFYNSDPEFECTWDFGDGNTSSAHNPVHTYQLAGKYDVNLIAQKGSCLDTVSKQVEIHPVGLEELNATPLSVYPNPTSGRVFIETNFKDLQFELTDLTGRLILKGIPDEKRSIDLCDQPDGIYLLTLFQNNNPVSHHKIYRR